MSDTEFKTHLRRGSTWKRGLFMLLFAVLYSLAELVLIAIAVFQFGAILLSGRKNEPLLELGAQLSRYMYAVLQYVTFNADVRPYPFAPWPGGGAGQHRDSDADRDTQALQSGH